MRTTHKVLIAAAAAAVMAMSAAADAQGFGPCFGGPGAAGWGGGPGARAAGGGPGYGPGMGWGGPRGAGPAATSEVRLAYLKNELKLTSGQEAAWSAYESAVKQQAAAMESFRNAMFQSESATDRAALHTEHAKQRASSMEAMSTALKNLYAVLTPEQKTIADANLGGRFFAMGPRGPGRFR